MKKMLTIILSIALCFSFVVSVSAEGYENQYFSADTSLNGQWTEHYEHNIEFNSDSSQIVIQIMDKYALEKETGPAFMEFYDGFKAICDENPDFHSFSEGMLGGFPALVADETDENGENIVKETVILTDDFLCVITFSTEAGSGEYGYFGEFLNNINLKSSYTGDITFDTAIEYTDVAVSPQPAEEAPKEPEKDNTALVVTVVSVISAIAFVIVACFIFRKKK